MKILLSMGILMFALSFCNLAEKFTGQKDFKPAPDSTESNDTPKQEEIEAEKAKLTPEMSELLDGEELKWEEQGLSWKLPKKGWGKNLQNRTMIQYGSPGAGFLIVTIAPMTGDFPTDISLKANYTRGIEDLKNGKYKEVKYTEIDGLKGVETIETPPEDKGDAQRHQWISFREYGGQKQMLSVMVSTNGNNFEKQADTLQAILYSMGIVK